MCVCVCSWNSVGVEGTGKSEKEMQALLSIPEDLTVCMGTQIITDMKTNVASGRNGSTNARSCKGTR